MRLEKDHENGVFVSDSDSTENDKSMTAKNGKNEQNEQNEQ